MMSASVERLHDLLADRALVGLETEESYELEGLLREHPEVDAASFDTAAAAVALASLPVDAMPSHLFARIEADAVALLAHRPESRYPAAEAPRGRDRAALARTAPMPDVPARPTPSAPPPPAPYPLAPTSPPLRPVPYVEGRASRPPAAPPGPASPPPPAGYVHDARIAPAVPSAPVEVARVEPLATNVVPLRAAAAPSRAWLVSGWVAAAAILLLAIGAYVTKKPAEIATVPPPPSVPLPAPTPPSPPSPAAAREALLAEAGTVRTEWTATKDPAAKGAKGDVVWNAKAQKGFMRFSGLAKNDPAGAQYQLWIFDKTRDDKFPVDGGVFDVDADTGDVVVPITARLPVAEAALFAVTVEKPGGVVVSKRERIVVTAKPVG